VIAMMDDNLFAQIIDYNTLIIPKPTIEDIGRITALSSAVVKHAVSSTVNNSSSNNQFDISFVGALKSSEKESIISSSYVKYKIAVRRRSDGEEHTVLKRYRELKSFYTEVKEDDLQ
jgi:hypothetical protein